MQWKSDQCLGPPPPCVALWTKRAVLWHRRTGGRRNYQPLLRRLLHLGLGNKPKVHSVKCQISSCFYLTLFVHQAGLSVSAIFDARPYLEILVKLVSVSFASKSEYPVMSWTYEVKFYSKTVGVGTGFFLNIWLATTTPTGHPPPLILTPFCLKKKDWKLLCAELEATKKSSSSVSSQLALTKS